MMFKPHIFDVASLQHSQLHLCRFMCVCVHTAREISDACVVCAKQGLQVPGHVLTQK